MIDSLEPRMKLTEFEVHKFVIKYEELPDWDVYARLDEKAYKTASTITVQLKSSAGSSSAPTMLNHRRI